MNRSCQSPELLQNLTKKTTNHFTEQQHHQIALVFCFGFRDSSPKFSKSSFPLDRNNNSRKYWLHPPAATRITTKFSFGNHNHPTFICGLPRAGIRGPGGVTLISVHRNAETSRLPRSDSVGISNMASAGMREMEGVQWNTRKRKDKHFNQNAIKIQS